MGSDGIGMARKLLKVIEEGATKIEAEISLPQLTEIFMSRELVERLERVGAQIEWGVDGKYRWAELTWCAENCLPKDLSHIGRFLSRLPKEDVYSEK